MDKLFNFRAGVPPESRDRTELECVLELVLGGLRFYCCRVSFGIGFLGAV